MNEVKKKRIYLSGLISGYDLNGRREAFARKKAELEGFGYEVFNPLENGLPADAATSAHMRRDFEELLRCDAIYMMSRSFASAGCMTEFHVATAIGLDVYFEDYRPVGDIDGRGESWKG